ncbi:ATP-binding cassette domain-containing protein [Actinoplanes sp. NBRC 103695]|uniref:ATP-binding cassette domain-containing protein n=1 Tax=Actinoplanes sp. NBRC 103695 TaxID=3032202 RepID=UPI0024A1434A|nr:ATP-binding cassette domain-containing protein [Actinoplanes sp. NBRC 103695]GLZ00770.1 hypothetical protein Acsp02_80220 [Actinoplanes sp. NBRC 103695]
MNAQLLHVDGVSYGYGAAIVLHPVSLHIAAGSRHAVIGPNGAGKSTLLNVIAGNLIPPAGDIRLGQRPVTRLREGARARLGIGRTFQHPAVVEQLTAAENVTLAIRHRRMRRQKVRAALEQVGLGDYAGTPAGQLPYGQRRLLELAVVFAAQPQLLLLDEPSAGLDPSEITHVGTIIRQLPDTAAVIMVDHHLPLLFDLATTITVLAAGQHVFSGTADEVREHPVVQAVYLSPATPDTIPTNQADQQEPGGAATAGKPSRLRRTLTATADTAAVQEPAVLQVDSLHAAYHGATVLDDITLSVDAGNVQAILGRNGAGKSTLLNTIAGLHRPHRHTRIRVAGVELRPAQPADAGRHGIALVPQGRRLFASLTIREHLALATRHTRRQRQDARWSIDDVLDLLPALRDKLRRYPAQMSGGEQQMAAIARALLTGPRLLLLDEPTEGLAPQVVDQLTATITRIAGTGVAVLLAEQNQRAALATADRISVLDAARIAFSTTDINGPATHARLAGYLGVSTAGAAA